MDVPPRHAESIRGEKNLTLDLLTSKFAVLLIDLT